MVMASMYGSRMAIHSWLTKETPKLLGKRIILGEGGDPAAKGVFGGHVPAPYWKQHTPSQHLGIHSASSSS